MDIPIEIEVTEAARLAKQPDTVLLDVREPYELAICQLNGSLNIPMRSVPGRLAEIPRDQRILVLCHVGARSLRVTEFLRANGYTNVSNIAGGTEAWSQEVDPGLARY
ncbi:MAG TPA: rhodanese-like domain-containing protein [Lacunisphaera sp.]|jgi:rhodanese-related sulfurtransferase